jgi:hypothetical protein
MLRGTRSALRDPQRPPRSSQPRSAPPGRRRRALALTARVPRAGGAALHRHLAGAARVPSHAAGTRDRPRPDFARSRAAAGRRCTRTRLFGSRGGSDDPTNLVSLCAPHRLHGVHRGFIRVYGRAPDGLTWELAYPRENKALRTHAAPEAGLGGRRYAITSWASPRYLGAGYGTTA